MVSNALSFGTSAATLDARIIPIGSADVLRPLGSSVELVRRRVGVRGGRASPNGMGDAAWRIIITEWTAFTKRAFPEGGGAF